MAKAVVAGILPILICACSGANEGLPKFALDMCRRVPVYSSIDGQLIVGAEDGVPDLKNRELIFSAYDRRAVEKAISKNGAPIPQGNVYRLSFDDLFAHQGDNIVDGSIIDTPTIDTPTIDTPIVATPILDPTSISGGLRPHGLSFNPESRLLSFINRTYPIRNKRRKKISQIITIPVEMSSGAIKISTAPCAANDIIHSTGQQTMVTFDHQSCGFDGILEDLFNKNLTGVWRGGGVVLSGLKFANGIAAIDQLDEIAIAATRSKEVVFAKWAPEGLAVGKRIKTPGGPDNISQNRAGELIVAVHPSMLRLALHRKLGFGRAPSRIIKIDPDTKNVTMLLDDERGEKFAAATVGVDIEGHLVVGSVVDSGFLVCTKGVTQ